MAKKYRAVNNIFLNNETVSAGSVVEIDDELAQGFVERGSVVEFDGKSDTAPAAPEAPATEAPLPQTDSQPEESTPEVKAGQPSPEEIAATLEQAETPGPTSSDVQLS